MDINKILKYLFASLAQKVTLYRSSEAVATAESRTQV